MGAHDFEALAKALAAKMTSLPREAIAEIEAFINSVAKRGDGKAGHRGLTGFSRQASAASFAAVWGNPEDDVYDEL